MRTAVTLKRFHGETDFELMAGPQVPLPAHLQNLRESLALAAAGPHPELAEVQLWTSDGGLERSVKFLSPEDYELREANRQRDEQAHLAHVASKEAKLPPAAKSKPAPAPGHD